MYVMSQVVGGWVEHASAIAAWLWNCKFPIFFSIATQRYGTKSVFGWSQLATAIGSLCIPAAASTHWVLLVFVRSIQGEPLKQFKINKHRLYEKHAIFNFSGFASGLTWPAMYAIVAHWIPPNERSRFMSSFQGFSIGIGLTYPLCGFIIKHFGWRPCF